MRTICTDNFGLYPWFALFCSAVSFWSAFDNDDVFGLGERISGVLWALMGCFWLFLALRRLRQVRIAKREGRDPTIMGTKQDCR